MTFEDFKKEFEIWRKIDTLEVLEICKSQYQQKLLIEEDNNYFEPIELENDSGYIELYYKNLNKILGVDNLTERQICLVILPSFEPESLLVVDSTNDEFTLTYKSLATNYWTNVYNTNNSFNVEVDSKEVKISNKLGVELFSFFESILEEAREPKVQMITLDGTNVFLYNRVNGKLNVVKKSFNINESKSGQVINLLILIMENFNSINSTFANEIEEKIFEINKKFN